MSRSHWRVLCAAKRRLNATVFSPPADDAVRMAFRVPILTHPRNVVHPRDMVRSLKLALNVSDRCWITRLHSTVSKQKAETDGVGYQTNAPPLGWTTTHNGNNAAATAAECSSFTPPGSMNEIFRLATDAVHNTKPVRFRNPCFIVAPISDKVHSPLVSTLGQPWQFPGFFLSES